MGVLLVVFPIGVAWVLGALALGALLHQVALLHGLGVLTLPVLSGRLGQPVSVTWACVALVLLMIVKRLEANQGCRALRTVQRRVWLNRLLHDRDEY